MTKTNSRRSGLVQRLTLGPYTVWAALFIVVPLCFIAYYAFTDNDFKFTLDNVARFFTATSSVGDGGGGGGPAAENVEEIT